MNKVTDRMIIQKVTQQLYGRGMQSPCHIDVTAHSGDVILSGTILYEHQRQTALHAVRDVNSVRHIVDNLRVQSMSLPHNVGQQ